MKKIIYLLLVLQIASSATSIQAQGRWGDPKQDKWGIELTAGTLINNLKSPANTGAGGIESGTLGIDVSQGIGDWFRVGLELEHSSRSYFNWGKYAYYMGDPANSPAYVGAAYLVMQNNFRGWNIYYGLSFGTLYAKYNGAPYLPPLYERPGTVENALIACVKLGVERKVYRKLYFDVQYKFGRTWVYENGKNPSRHDLQGTYNTLNGKIGLKYYFL